MGVRFPHITGNRSNTMNKQEIRAAMEAKGILKTNGSHDALWVKAFELFNAGQTSKLKMGCGSCYNKVRQWLLS